MVDPHEASPSPGSEPPSVGSGASGSAGGHAGSFPLPFGEDYLLIEEIARGAMGVVYRAKQLSLAREVALKTILANHLATERTVQRFLSEAKSAAGLDHPGIVPVHDVGVVSGQHYYTMAYIEGDSLARRLEDGPLAFEEAARVALETAEALQSAHESGVLHRDIKPGNILLDGGGHAVVTDFGLSRSIEENSGLSMSGDAIGTPSYMAPEQAVGQLDGLGPTTDVYGVGALLYAMLAGRAPFVGPNVVSTLQAVKERDPLPLSVLRPEVPRDLETICHRCLHKIPERRYASASALAQDLRRWLAGEPIEARPVGTLERAWMWVRRHPMVSGFATASAVLLVAGTLGVTWQWRKAVRLLGERDRADAARIEALRSGIESASASAVLAKLDDVLPLGDEYAEDLGRQCADRHIGPVARARAHLCLVLDGRMPTEVLVEDLDALADRADEVRLLIEGMGRDLGQRPGEAESLIERLRMGLGSPSDNDSRSRVAARALALLYLEPGEAVWSIYGRDLEEHLLQVDSQDLGDTLAVLPHPPEPLLESMLDVAAGENGLRAYRASEVLCAWVDDRPDVLLRLILSVDGEAFAPIGRWLVRASSGPGAGSELGGLVEPLSELLAAEEPPRVPPSDNGLAPITGATLDDLRSSLGAETSRVTGSWALALRVEVDDVDLLADRLARHGYRPVRVRPYSGPLGDEWAAVAWVRDGAEFELVTGVDPWELQGLDQEQTERGWVPLDVAVHGLGGGADPRLSCVWIPRPEDVIEGSLRLTMGPEEERRLREEMQDKLFAPIATHFQVEPGASRSIHASVWWRGSRAIGAYFNEAISDEDVPRLYPERLVRDLQGVLPADLGQAEDCHPRWFAVATDDPDWGSIAVHADEATEFWDRLEEVLSGDETPIGIAVVPRDACPSPRIATLWAQRRTGFGQRIDHERRRRRAAFALFHLGLRDPFWRRVRPRKNPGLANQLMVSFPSYGLDPRLLVERLEHETDPRARQLLIRGLGMHEPGTLRPAVLADLLERIRAWPAEERAAGMSAELLWFAGRHDPDGEFGFANDGVGRVAANGHRMVRIEPEGEPRFGSEPGEFGRTSAEPLHRIQGLRPFEMSIAEVSESQMAPFYAVYPALRVSGATGQDSPARCSWFVAIAYCRWLSEQAGIEEGEIPYPPVEQIFSGADEVLIPDDFQDRIGFRLPTEYEWEFACRGGSEASYHFGDDPALLGRLVVFKGSASDGPGPRTSCPPNALGLFGTHGNLSEWTHSSFGAMNVDPFGRSVEPPPAVANIFEGFRVVRGGSFLSTSTQVRSAVRLRGAPNASSTSVGFRIVRSLP